ncbi:hypothetical protein Clacol_008272 [Clathrus columnatus]|uniref:Aldehyde dehydrogenase domain-containing protein n=1 Tax=Clathrus columnatus TaxID=1419009 RepID=A0AAV5AMC8_9AGAM|nr:hypothetical protein Clacol_008272 [Clathrus columnatus]
MPPRHVQLVINGEKRRSSSGENFSTYHPATGDHIGVVESASSNDIQRAIDAASAAFPAWEDTLASNKRRILNKAADLLESEKYIHAFSESVPSEIGSVSFGGIIEAHVAASQLREVSAQAAQIFGETFPSGRIPGAQVLAIAPWNSPVNLAARAVAMPLICGNTVILRSSEAGLPKGVVNLIHIAPERNPELVPEIIANPAIKHINQTKGTPTYPQPDGYQFTGGDRVGRIIAGEAGKNLKPVVLELGGKAASVVLDDANIKLAARGIISGAMLNSGQICMSSERIIVQRGAADELISELTTLAKKLKAGPNGTDANLAGVCNSTSAERIVNLLKDAKEKGAEIVLGDLTHEGPFIQPHIVLGYTPEMQAWQQETFGPVFGITVCDTVDEAINLANATDYTLTSALWTSSISGLRLASRIRAGKPGPLSWDWQQVLITFIH